MMTPQRSHRRLRRAAAGLAARAHAVALDRRCSAARRAPDPEISTRKQGMTAPTVHASALFRLRAADVRSPYCCATTSMGRHPHLGDHFHPAAFQLVPSPPHASIFPGLLRAHKVRRMPNSRLGGSSSSSSSSNSSSNATTVSHGILAVHRLVWTSILIARRPALGDLRAAREHRSAAPQTRRHCAPGRSAALAALSTAGASAGRT